MTGVIDLLNRLPRQAREAVRTALYGLGGGAAAVLFQLGIEALYANTYLPLSRQPVPVFLAGSLGVILLTSLAAGWLLTRFCPGAAGSGIPQLKVAFWKDFGHVPWRVGWVKFVAGILSVGGGASLGREGPSVQLSGAVGATLAGRLGEPKQSRRTGAAAGAAAGLAAAFNTPLAAVTFVLEEIVQDLNSRLLGSVLLASVVGAFVVHAVIGRQPAFQIGPADASRGLVYVLTVLVAALAAAVGALFQRLTLRVRETTRSGSLSRVPAWLRPGLGAFLTWMIGVAVFLHTGRLGVFSLGYGDLNAGLADPLGWQVAALLLAAKLAATVLCYGLGGCGGIFSPTLFLGGMCGLAVGGLAGPALGLDPPAQVLLAVVGMSACLGAVVRAPVTGILIVFEMTHAFNLVPALMLGALVSQGVSHLIMKHNFYDAVLVQDGLDLDRVRPPRDLAAWHQWPVSTVARFQPVCLDSLEPVALAAALRRHPYRRFPVTEDGRVRGMLTRAEAEAALAERRPPRLAPHAECAPDASIRDVQRSLIDSPTGVVLLVSRPGGPLLGLATLHDLMRAEMALADSAGPSAGA